jgi:hypothetical protein
VFREMSALTMMDVLMTTLRGATDAEMLAFMQLLNDRGIPLFYAGEEARAPEPKAKAEPKAKKEPKEPKPKVEVEMPVAVDGAAPEASAYRIAAVDLTTCVGRLIDGCDKRWSPHILREKQCGKEMVDGYDLCKRCSVHEARYAETEKKTGQWTGRVTEEPLEWVHMLGTAWAETRVPKFNASAPVPSPVPAADKKAEAAAKKAAAAAEKEAKKAAAEKEKEAKKAAAAAKKAAAEAKKAEKAAAKPKKEAKAKAE